MTEYNELEHGRDQMKIHTLHTVYVRHLLLRYLRYKYKYFTRDDDILVTRIVNIFTGNLFQKMALHHDSAFF